MLEATLWGNTGQDYLIAAAVLVVSYAALKWVQRVVLGRLREYAEKTETDIDDLIIGLFRHLKPPFYLTVSLYFALRTLALSAFLQGFINKLVIAVVILYATFLVAEVVTYIIKRFLKGHDLSSSMEGIMTGVARLIVWVFAILTILSNLGVNVTSFIAGLGIGGLAIAFAFQNILEDIFSSFSIFIDKPFREGDRITLGTEGGIVERIGIKTTRIRTPQGEQLVVSNRELTSAQIHNFGAMERRRNVSVLGVTYDTPKEKLEKLPVLMQEVVANVPHASYDRCHLKEFAGSSINFELVFFMETSNYKEYLDGVQYVNLGLVELFEREGIEFAFPTQTIHLQQSQ